MMKKIFTSIFLLLPTLAMAQNRFPKPDFESGYQYPDMTYPIPDEALWTAVDIFLLIALMSFVAWAVIRKRTRKPIIWVSIISVAYFGFFRSGCVCSIGSIQNVALALVDNSYILPISVFLFFMLPVVFVFLFGRVFCAGVCPFGALQELVNLKNYRLPKAVTTALGMIPWIYLIFALLYAVTRSSFIICRFDPFIGIFRLGGDIGLILFGVLLLVTSVFIGRPFCRFLCPYGALLSLFSRVSIWKVEITQKPCINCELCHHACPVDAIRAPYDNKVKETRLEGVKRIMHYCIVLPLIIAVGAFLMQSFSGQLSRVHKEVKLYDMVMQHEADPQDILSVELEAFYGQGGTLEELTEAYNAVQADFRLYAAIAGALIGLVIGLTLISLSLKRTRTLYEIDHAACVACGKCFSYCPQNKI
ncbi:NosR/NirI family nitrous oxide reductase transcriptional regulator [Parabacteroides sp. PFB2-12]|uniref:4Fe-4S binding protein n=1 Tax=unclassified Parabacteroides TaxID=2649774 RepID=UPI0024750D37|nr:MULTISPECIES: 4Fe-4S binding protein [unclassified Parabacteroides]MDH6342120.1 NosR/NirI family nitrous oxide reductase transcriptional regulator [Parabacteroides sp. PM6-13]MDH6389539.1 NosR/NirI family nitrous oxide reductase transcriptional regulator [Parabacteroides sp. PFB2-12]